ncbi:transglycosylase SLT domain-containing protein [Rhodopseudomonas sp. NSM]|uniref:transglycosylase SLT domain-containing protein n=1 Tax=Rhodopseudomonas sp. NSM TaxID=3457630 RepID=UPI004036F875
MPIALALTALSICSLSGAARANGPCERQMALASVRHGVPLGVLYSVGLTETGAKNVLRPYALNVDGRTVVAGSLSEAMAEFTAARRSGARLVDLGCMQINHYYHGGKFAEVESMFDPARNVDYAARFLRELRAREGSWTMAVARYNAGPANKAGQRRYVCSVIGNLVASGFGAWTGDARSFCGPPAAPK